MNHKMYYTASVKANNKKAIDKGSYPIDEIRQIRVSVCFIMLKIIFEQYLNNRCEKEV